MVGLTSHYSREGHTLACQMYPTQGAELQVRVEGGTSWPAQLDEATGVPLPPTQVTVRFETPPLQVALQGDQDPTAKCGAEQATDKEHCLARLAAAKHNA